MATHSHLTHHPLANGRRVEPVSGRSRFQGILRLLSRLSEHFTTSAAVLLTTSVLVVGSMACSGAAKRAGFSSLRAACSDGEFFNATTKQCKAYGTAAQLVAKGETELADGELESALKTLTAAKISGPHPHTTHVRVFEQLGIAHSYAGNIDAAQAAFRQLLHLKPNHLISYNTSPQATLKFEQARNKVAEKATPSIVVNWPDDAKVSRGVPIEVEVIADPAKMLTQATLYLKDRDQKSTPTRAIDVALAPAGKRTMIKLPRLGGSQPRTLDMHLVARDSGGNEVLLWASQAQPRTIRLGYVAPEPLYKKWWVLTIAGAVLIGGGGSAAYFVFRSPPDNVGGKFGLQ